jgi:hypothetical protein
MRKYRTNILVFESVLSYPSYLEKQANSMPRFLQETRIGNDSLMQNQMIYADAKQKVKQNTIHSKY